MGIFGIQKMLMCTLFWGGGGYQNVYGLYTHENVDIYGWRLSEKKAYVYFNMGLWQPILHDK